MDSHADSAEKRCYYAEKGVIGCVMLDESCFDVAFGIVKPQDFLNRNAELIFQAMVTLRERNTPINIATVITLIGGDEFFAQNDGLGFLISSSAEVGTAQNVLHYCKIVRSESVHRKLVSFADSIKATDWSSVEDADSEVARLEDELDRISDTQAVEPWSCFEDVLQSVCEELGTTDPPCLIKTGLCDLDSKLQLRPGALTIIAARPAVGKSALGINIMSHIAFSLKFPVAFFSLEMTKKEIVTRMISSQTGIDGKAFRNKKLDSNEWEKVMDFIAQYNKSSVYIDDTAGIDIATLRERARRLSRQYGICCIIIDYLQLMTADGKRVNTREQEVSRISRGLKLIAKDLHIPVIALSQLSRNLESRSDKHPVLSDLRESGAIEQDADNVLFLHREKEEGKEQYADLDIAKQRSGPIGRIKLYWDGSITKFTCMDENF
jgi:replicative DNA helicase